MYYSYFTRNGIEYASATESVRDGKRVTKGAQVYLGRVVDKELHLFRSRERGLFSYDIETGEFLDPPRGYDEPRAPRKNARPRPKVLTVSFGDAWMLDRFLRSCGLMACVEACCSIAGPAPGLDTVCALLEFYVLCSLYRCHAEDWWELTYAHMLYPRARMSSQRVSEALSDLGSKEVRMAFFAKYLELASRVDDGVLVDGAGVAGVANLPLTVVGYHAGDAGEGRWLIYVVQQRTGLPLFFRVMAGNIAGVPDVACTARELRELGMNSKFAILDAGHRSHANADAPAEAGDRVGKVLEIAGRGAKMLPADVRTEEALRGHLLLSFMATAALEMMSDRLAAGKTSLTTESMLWVLHEHHATVYDDEVMVQEPTWKMREAYEAFGLTCPEAIRR